MADDMSMAGPPVPPGPMGPPPSMGAPSPQGGPEGMPTVSDLNNVLMNVADELPPQAIQMLISTLQSKLAEKSEGAPAGPGPVGPGPGGPPEGLREAAMARAGGGMA